MTSPAQLKYLNAMDIPVWVSRELVSEKSISIVDADNVSQLNTNASTSNGVNKNQSIHSAQNIIASLNQTPKETSNVRNSETLDKAVAESVSETKIPQNSNPNSNYSVRSEADPSTLDNLLFKTTHHYVFATGSENADWMVIGHSPEPFNAIGYEPFAGEAGELLDNMLRAVNIEHPRQLAYMVNVLDMTKAHDESAATDLNTELAQKLNAIITKVKPKMLILVGQLAAQNLLQIDEPLIIMRSKVHQLTESKVPCVVTYYPTYLVQKPIDKRKAWNDLKLAMSVLSDVS